MLEIITSISDNLNHQQFLISHIVQPDRLFYRFKEKNIKKSINIIKFLEEIDMPIYEYEKWIIKDMDIVESHIDKFIHSLSIYINEIVINSDFVKLYDIYNNYRKNIIKLDNYIDIKNGKTQKLIDESDNEPKRINLTKKLDSMKGRTFQNVDEICEAFNKIKIYNDNNIPIKEYKKIALKMRDICKDKIMNEIISKLDILFQSINLGRLAGMYSDNRKINDNGRKQIQIIFKSITDIADFSDFIRCLNISDNNILHLMNQVKN
jgi:hypothetical protein